MRRGLAGVVRGPDNTRQQPAGGVAGADTPAVGTSEGWPGAVPDERTRQWHSAHVENAGFYTIRAPDRAYFLARLRSPVVAAIAALGRAHGRPLTILEVGCGSGADSVCLALQGHDVTTIDPSEHLLARARGLADVAAALFPARPLRLRVERGNVFDLPGAAGRYDVVLSFGVVVLWREEERRLRALANLRATLNPGGWLVLGTTNTTHPLFKLLPLIPLVADLADHNLAIMEGEVRQAGFAVVDRGAVGLSEHFDQWLANRLARFPLRLADRVFARLPAGWQLPVAPHVFVVARASGGGRRDGAGFG